MSPISVVVSALLFVVALLLLAYSFVYSPREQHTRPRSAPSPPPIARDRLPNSQSPNQQVLLANATVAQPSNKTKAGGVRRYEIPPNRRSRNSKQSHADKKETYHANDLEVQTTTSSQTELLRKSAYRDLIVQDAKPASVIQASPQRRCTLPRARPNLFVRWIQAIKRLFGAREPVNEAPVVTSFKASDQTLTLPCPPGPQSSLMNCPVKAKTDVRLKTVASDHDNAVLSYTYTVTAGRITGEGSEVGWDLGGVSPGAYVASVTIADDCAPIEPQSTTVTIANCVDCVGDNPCSQIDVSSSAESVLDGTLITFTAKAIGKTRLPTYNWTVSAGSIQSGQGTPSITVDTENAGGKSVTATVEFGGLDPSCARIASSTVAVTSKKGRLYGKVVDSINGGGLEDLPIKITKRDGITVVWSGRTGSGGSYSVELPTNDYLVMISRPRFADEIRRVSLFGDTEMDDIRIGPSVVSTPTPLPFPRPSPSPGSSPSPAPSATASPTVAASPNVARSPSVSVLATGPKGEKRHDQITVTYPDRFLTGGKGVITFDFSLVLAKVLPSSTTINANRIAVGPAPPNPGGTPGNAAYASFGENYDAYATVALNPSGLTIVKGPDRKWQPLQAEADNVRWQWELEPTDNAATDASFKFHIEVMWIAKSIQSTADVPVRFWQYDWLDESGESFAVKIGPSSFSVMVANYGSPASGFAGVLVLATRKRRRKRAGAGLSAEEQEVQTSVFAPAQAVPGNSFLVQVFVHLPKDAASLGRLARKAEPDAQGRITKYLDKLIKYGAELAVVLNMRDVGVKNEVRRFTWMARTQQIQFAVNVPKDCEPQKITGTVTICERVVVLTDSGEVTETLFPIGDLMFQLAIVKSTTEAAGAAVNMGAVRNYQNPFISYAHEEEGEVLRRVQGMQVQSPKYFMDFISLRTGGQWEHLLIEQVKKSDAFYLFWSKAASESFWVNREIDCALERQAGDANAPPAMTPFVIDGPPVTAPPEKLRHLQFDYIYTRLIDSAERFRSDDPE